MTRPPTQRNAGVVFEVVQRDEEVGRHAGVFDRLCDGPRRARNRKHRRQQRDEREECTVVLA
jgi:hypothetical protein